MSLAKKILKNSLSNSAAFAVEAIVAFSMMPFVIRHLGDDAYGIWFLVNGLTGYLGLFKTGFRPSINKHVSQYKALKDFNSLKQFMGASLHIFIYVSILILLTTLTVSYFLPSLFDGNTEYLEVFQVLLLFAGVQSMFSLLGTAYGGVVSGYQRYEINAGIEILVILVRAGLILYFLPSFPNLYTMAAAHFSITILGFLVTVVAARKIAPIKNLPIVKKPSRDVIKIILKYNSVSFAVSGLAILTGYLDSIIVGSIISMAVVTHYGVGSRLVKYCYNFLKVTTRVIAPAISELDATNKQETLNQILVATHKASCLFAYPVLFLLLFQGDDFILMWVGKGYEDSYQIMKVLALAAFFIAPTQSVNSYLYGIGKHKYLLYVMISEVALSVPLAIFLGSEYGAVGVAIGFTLPRAFLRSIVLPILVSKTSKSNMFFEFLVTKIRVLTACLPYAGFLLLAKGLDWTTHWLSFVLQLGLASIIYLIGSYVFGLRKSEKKKISGFILPLIKRSRSRSQA